MGLSIPIRSQATSAAAAEAGAVVADVSHYLRPGTLRLPALPPLSLYVHFPWCVRKCPYCDFNSHEHPGGLDALPLEDYVSALLADLEAALPLVWGRPVISIFFGGGTPSLLSVAALDRLLSGIRARLPLVPECEITLEANPGTFEAEKFAGFRASGINRLSVGVQSLDAQQLKQLGRVHDAEQARAALACAREHFENFNCDLMYALPEQTLAQAQADVEALLAIAGPHVSLYQLTLEPNTVFAKYPPLLPDEDTAAAIHDWIEARLEQGGYEHYEVSAYARPGAQSRHNLNYWRFGDYLGIGAGAHSKLSFPQRIVRQTRFSQPASYLGNAAASRFCSESIEVARADLAFEFTLNALRLRAGFAPSLFSERTGLPLSQIEAPLGEAEARGLLTRSVDSIAPTELGWRFLSDLQAMFLPKPRA
jgi:putative oxygen-independent coproporphyrinogen III oxidase